MRAPCCVAKRLCGQPHGAFCALPGISSASGHLSKLSFLGSLGEIADRLIGLGLLFAGAGARVVADANAGVGCAAGDADALAAAVMHLRSLSQPERAVLGDNGRRYAAEHYSLDRLANDLIVHLEGLTTIRREKHT